ncbi:MAG: phosphate ABC transporter permease subunit PstC [Hyphomicrobiales bacterium]|nr:phosphate ABC transporter permease subunit PstC [Hyphomicrobiales bacterium]
MLSYVLFSLLLLSIAGYYIGRTRSIKLVSGDEHKLHSRAGYHGAFIAAWIGVPTLILVLLWLMFQGTVVDQLLLASLPADKTANLSPSQIDLLISQIKSHAGGITFGEIDAVVEEAAARYTTWQAIAKWAMFAAALSLGIIGLTAARSRISPEFRARHGVERILTGFMIFCSTVAILTTLGIVLSLLFEAARFFAIIPVTDFLFGLNWEPQIALRADQGISQGAFGMIPVFAGTLLIAFIAMAVAVPIGLLSAVYLTEYAGKRFRAVVKPILEILAGVPTVVYGFFAILVVAPALREWAAMVGIEMAPNSALAAGFVMGIMIIPFVSSLSDDAINAVPGAMRDGSYAMGATKGETITKVLLPAALPGIAGGILLAISRAIGETMIVVMAAGIIAKLTANPLEPVTTVTVQIVTLLIGDSEFDNPKTLAAFALGLVLFFVTLMLNIIALRIVQKYREQYD